MGAVVGLHRTRVRRGPVEPIPEAVLREDWGVDGDRHARPRSSRQVLIVEAEVLDAVGMPAGSTREQVTVSGFASTLQAGDVLLAGPSARLELVRPRVPCAVMDGVRPGLERELRGRGGWCARVLAGGRVRVGDPVVRTDPVRDPPWIAEYLAAMAAWEASRPGTRRVDAVSAEDERVAAELDPAAAEALRAGPRRPTWIRHDDWSTLVLDAARAAPAGVAEPLLRRLAAHYRAS
jgi:MOSC domain-containing protein YiiM